ncbi:ABC transporter substrate-binding protein [Micromonospora vulcania]|uniref:ABC transporter substrate-binding protein n=1 Tax=Micromonospora vulcania TaxID=1441873 RepID=A0ABW1H4L9_9ACTN
MSLSTKRRALLALALGAVPLLAIGGCAQGGDTGGAPSTVRMLVNITDNLTPEYWDALVKPFEEQSGLDVKIEAPTGKDVASTFPTLLAAGTAPDVVQSITPQTDTAPELVDLSGEDWAKDTPLVDKYAIDGKRLVAGAGMQAQSLVFYNKKAFQAAGITETPKYWDQFEVSLGKLKTAGYIPLQTGGQWLTGLQVQQLWHPTLNTQHPDWVQSLAKGDLALGDAYEPILKRYADWIHAGYINKSDVGLDSSGADANFIAGKVGFYTGGSWFASSLKKTGNLPFEVGVFSPPVESGQAYPGPQGATLGAPYSIWKGAKNLDGAKALVKYLVTDKKAIQTQLDADGIFRAGFTTSVTGVGAGIQGIVDAAPGLVLPANNDVRMPVTGFNQEFTTVAQKVYSGTSSGDAAKSLNQWFKDNRR